VDRQRHGRITINYGFYLHAERVIVGRTDTEIERLLRVGDAPRS
jgi:hypothetical protein